jgi:hypothetical protein
MEEMAVKGTKRRLKGIGIRLIFLAIVCAMVFPMFGPARHTGMNAAEREQYDRDRHLWELRNASLSGVLLGAGLALLIAGYAIREERVP